MTELMSRYPYCHSVAEIDRSVLRDNARYLHRNLAPGVGSIAVIKANAYGHGAVTVARALTDIYDMYAVATVAEAVELRDAGVRHPILVFGVPLAGTAKAYVEYDLSAVVSSPDHFDLLQPGTSYHVEIDSGMGRLGIYPAGMAEIRERIRARKEITCRGIMTHFSTADEQGSDHLLHQKKVLSEICDFFRDDFPVHAANSAASLAHPDTHLDMVRHGIALYGYDPTQVSSGELRPVMRWKSWIAQCKPVRKGQPLSYGAVWQAPEDGCYAVVPVGYADGYRRGLSGRIPVLVEGKWYPQVGTVTMDYVMAWLGQDSYPTGTEVVIMGAERNHAGIWAEALNTIPYEICTGIHPKVPRITV